MPRIGGLVSSAPLERLTADLRHLLAGFSHSDGRTEVVTLGTAALGAVSSSTAGAAVARCGSLVGVLDGFLCGLPSGGHVGAVQSPFEAWLALVDRAGIEPALHQVSGDFALAVHDTRTSRTWLVRDRLGVRPLYYATRPEGLAFASQPGKLLRLSGVSPKVSHRYLGLFAGSHYRTFDNDPRASPFSAVAQLPAGHLLEMAGAEIRSVRQYWALTDQPDWTAPDAVLAEQYRDLLASAVRARLNVARRPAFTLSGGMDSSSVLASAAQSRQSGQHAYSSVYTDPTFDESAEIGTMLGRAVAEWHPVRVDSPDVFTLVSKMVRAHDEPVATATWLSHFLLCERVAADGFDSLFGGLGGDELNAGEYEYFFFHFADMRYTGNEHGLRTEVAHWAAHHDHPIYRKNQAVAEAALSRLVDLQHPGLCLVDRARVDRYAHTVNRDFFDVEAFEPVMDRPFRSYLKNRTYQDIFRETAPCCLRAEDRQAWHAGLDHFDPFFDHKLVEFMFRVPARLKIKDGVTKILLREAMRGILPEATRTRVKKTGWNAPAHVWFSGEGLSNLYDLVGSRSFVERGIYDVAAVHRVLKEHEAILRDQTPRENHMMFLWQLVNLELWLRDVDAVVAR